jgi:hypothetical protein
MPCISLLNFKSVTVWEEASTDVIHVLHTKARSEALKALIGQAVALNRRKVNTANKPQKRQPTLATALAIKVTTQRTVCWDRRTMSNNDNFQKPTIH